LSISVSIGRLGLKREETESNLSEKKVFLTQILLPLTDCRLANPSIILDTKLGF